MRVARAVADAANNSISCGGCDGGSPEFVCKANDANRPAAGGARLSSDGSSDGSGGSGGSGGDNCNLRGSSFFGEDSYVVADDGRLNLSAGGAAGGAGEAGEAGSFSRPRFFGSACAAARLLVAPAVLPRVPRCSSAAPCCGAGFCGGGARAAAQTAARARRDSSPGGVPAVAEEAPVPQLPRYIRKRVLLTAADLVSFVGDATAPEPRVKTPLPNRLPSPPSPASPASPPSASVETVLRVCTPEKLLPVAAVARGRGGKNAADAATEPGADPAAAPAADSAAAPAAASATAPAAEAKSLDVTPAPRRRSQVVWPPPPREPPPSVSAAATATSPTVSALSDGPGDWPEEPWLPRGPVARPQPAPSTPLTPPKAAAPTAAGSTPAPATPSRGVGGVPVAGAPITGAPVILIPGGGIFFFWKAGFVKYLVDHFDVSGCFFVGSSAGALASFLAVCLPGEILRACRLAIKIAMTKNVWQHSTFLAGVLQDIGIEWLERLFPAESGLFEQWKDTTSLRTRLCIVASRLSRRLRLEGFVNFNSRRDVYECVLASIHIPIYANGRPATLARQRAYLDGSFGPDLTKTFLNDELVDRTVRVLCNENDYITPVSLADCIRKKPPDALFNLVKQGYRYAAMLHQRRHPLIAPLLHLETASSEFGTIDGSPLLDVASINSPELPDFIPALRPPMILRQLRQPEEVRRRRLPFPGAKPKNSAAPPQPPPPSARLNAAPSFRRTRAVMSLFGARRASNCADPRGSDLRNASGSGSSFERAKRVCRANSGNLSAMSAGSGKFFDSSGSQTTCAPVSSGVSDKEVFLTVVPPGNHSFKK